jgi:hypothetical protein
MGSNLDYEGIQKAMTMIQPALNTKRKESKKEEAARIGKEWNRLASFMRQRK